jgi:hypothetical protein
MTATKKLGIWMDHASAHVMEFRDGAIVSETMELKPVEEKQAGFRRNEILIHQKEQHQQSEYYKQLGEAIRGYDDVVLFGPTDAKVELFNHLVKDHSFSKVKIKTEHADKMTENQQHAFVKEYFKLR